MLSHLFCQRCLNGQLYQFSVANSIVVENTPCLTQIFYEKLPSTLKIFYLQLEFRILTPCLGHHRCLVEKTRESYLYNNWECSVRRLELLTSMRRGGYGTLSRHKQAQVMGVTGSLSSMKELDGQICNHFAELNST